MASGAGLYLYRADTFEELWTGLVQHGVSCVAWAPDSERMATGTAGKAVIVWDVETGGQLRTLKTHNAHNSHADFVRSVAWSPDGERLAFNAWGRTLKVWDAETGELLDTLEWEKSSIVSIAWSPDGTKLASGLWNGMVNVWDSKTGELLYTLEGHDEFVNVAWSPDSARLASGAYDGKVIIWDSGTGRQLRTFEREGDSIYSVAWSPDGEQLAIGGFEGIVVIWDAETGEQLLALEGHTESVSSVAWLPEPPGGTGGEMNLISGAMDGIVIAWNAETGEQLRTLEGHTAPVLSVAWSPDSNRLVSGSLDGMRVWNTSNDDEVEMGALLNTPERSAGSVSGAAWSPDGNQLASGSWDDNTVVIWDGETGKKLRTLKGHSEAVSSVAWSPDGAMLASGSYDEIVIIWDAETGEKLLSLEGHSEGVKSVSWSPDSVNVTSASFDDTMIIWDVETGEQISTLEGHYSPVSSAAWSPDGKRIASGSWDETVIIWNPKTGEQLHNLKGHGVSVKSVSWSPDGELLASGEYGIGNVIVWDTETGEELHSLEAHGRPVTSVAWSPDGAMLASGSWDGTVIIWDATLLGRPPIPTPTPGPSPTPTLEAGLTGPFRSVTSIDVELPGKSWERRLSAMPDDTLWLYTDEGIAVLRDTTAWEVYLSEFPGTLVGFDDSGMVWVVSEDASEISSWDGITWTRYDADEGWMPIEGWWDLPVQRDMQRDQAGRLWVGTTCDVRLFEGGRWTVFTPEDMSMEHPEYEYEDADTSYHVKILRDGAEIWVSECDLSPIGPMGGEGMRWFDGETWYGANSPVAKGCAGDIEEDSSGRIWAGLDGALWLYEPASREWTNFTPPDLLPSLENHWYGMVIDINLDPSGDPWVTFLLCGGAGCEGMMVLHHFHDGEWTQMTDPYGWFGAGQHLVFDANGTGWLFGVGVIYRLEGDMLEPVATLDASLVTVDADGQLWFVAYHEGQEMLWTLEAEMGD